MTATHHLSKNNADRARAEARQGQRPVRVAVGACSYTGYVAAVEADTLTLTTKGGPARIALARIRWVLPVAEAAR